MGINIVRDIIDMGKEDPYKAPKHTGHSDNSGRLIAILLLGVSFLSGFALGGIIIGLIR